MEINYSFEDVPTLYDFYNCNKRISGVMGAVGSGKSSTCVWKLIKHSREQEPSPVDGLRHTRWLIVRSTYPQLKDATVKKVLEWLPDGIFGTYKVADHDYFIDAFPGCKIEFNFRALDTPKHVRNLLSTEYTGVWINEAREIQKPIFDALDSRIGRYNIKDVQCTYKGIIMDFNAPDEENWLYKYFEVTKPDNAKLLKQPSARSPYAENTHNLPSDYYTELIKGKDEDWIRVYIDNEYGFVREGEPVYTGKYADHLHTARNILNPIPGRPIIVGLDFGLTPSAVICQITPRGYFNIIEEFESESMGIERFSQNILRPLFATKYRGYDIIITGDPAGKRRSDTDEKSCYEILFNVFPDYNIKPAVTNTPVSRIGAVEYFLTNYVDLGIPCLQISPNCKVLRKCFSGGYVKDKLGNPKKNRYSHLSDALQYAALYMMEEYKRVSKMKRVIKKPPYIPPSHIGL